MAYSIAGENSNSVCGSGTVARQALSIIGEVDIVKEDPGVTSKV